MPFWSQMVLPRDPKIAQNREKLCSRGLPESTLKKVIKNYAPSLIINYGTAGSLNKELRGLVEVTRFFQRDMDATPLGFKIGQTPFDDISEINLGSGGGITIKQIAEIIASLTNKEIVQGIRRELIKDGKSLNST